jgi:dipeptidyl aminopeptidase/acylaminoacyl peptidase
VRIAAILFALFLSPFSYADNFSTPMMLTIGEKDYRVPVNQTIAAWTYLQRKQVPGRLLVFHDADHWIMKGAEAKHHWEEVHRLAAKISPRPGSTTL